MIQTERLFDTDPDGAHRCPTCGTRYQPMPASLDAATLHKLAAKACCDELEMLADAVLGELEAR